MSPDWKNRRALKFLIPRMDANIVVSRGLKKWHKEIDNFDTENFTVIYNGADMKRLQPTGKSLREELNFQSALLIGMSGLATANAQRPVDALQSSAKFLPKFRMSCIFAGNPRAARKRNADAINLHENKIIERFLFSRTQRCAGICALD